MYCFARVDRRPHQNDWYAKGVGRFGSTDLTSIYVAKHAYTGARIGVGQPHWIGSKFCAMAVWAHRIGPKYLLYFSGADFLRFCMDCFRQCRFPSSSFCRPSIPGTVDFKIGPHKEYKILLTTEGALQ